MMTPSAAYHRLSFHPPAPVLFGLDARIDSLLGLYHKRSSLLD